MADNKTSVVQNKRLSPAVISAYSESISHHGNVVQSFATSFVNIHALFTAGAVAACISVIPTTYGQAVISSSPIAAFWMIVFFGLGFFSSATLMVIIFQNSIKKYRRYRTALKNNETIEKIEEYILYHALGYLALAGMLSGTYIGIIIGLVILST